MTRDDILFFSIDSRLLFQLGEKLVTNRAVAVAELIKNSYDADATHVLVRMNNIRKPGGTIIVQDNGTGMSPTAFERTWMRIATIDKEENPISETYQRQKAGKKGIGRFACRRLSKSLRLRSVAATQNGERVQLDATFSWPSFKPGSDVDKIPVRFSVKDVDADEPTGTTLILEETNEAWNGRDIRRLRNELTDLISPTTYKPERDLEEKPKEYDPGFEMEFECTEFPAKEKRLDETFFRNAWAKLSGRVDENGEGVYQIQVVSKIRKKIRRKFKRAEAFKFLRSAELEVFIFSYRSDLFKGSEWGITKAEKTGRERGGIKVYADKFRVFGYGAKGDDWLRLDYDRSRSASVLDEEVDDYAEEDKRPGLRLFMNRALFGHVAFQDNDNPMLEITVNRERLVDTAAFEDLRKFVRLGIEFATVLYANEIFRERKEKRDKMAAEEAARRREEQEAKERAEAERRKAEERAKRAEAERRKAEERAKRAEAERRKAEDERRKMEEARRKAEEDRRWMEKEMFSTARQSVKERYREIQRKERGFLELEEVARKDEKERIIIETEAKRMYEDQRARSKKDIEQAELDRMRAEEDLIRVEKEELDRKRDLYEREFSMLRVLASSGTLVLIFEHELQALIEDMEEVSISFSSLLDKLGEKERTTYENVLKSFGDRIEMIKELGEFLGLTVGRESRLDRKEWVLFPVVESVFSPLRWYFKNFGVEPINAVPEHLRTPRMYRSELVSILHNLMTNAFKAVKGQPDRRIEVRGFTEDDVLHIWFLDSGKGLDKDIWERVFEPFESESEPDLRFGAGTGLGLKLVRDMVGSYGGDAKFIDPPEDWTTCVQITLPVR